MGKVKSKEGRKKKVKNKGKQDERQRMLTAERVKRFRAKMTEEEWEEKRRKDRERYRKRKEDKLIKPISQLSTREQRQKRKIWRKNSKHYRLRKKAVAQVVQNTPPNSDEEIIEERIVSRQKKQGRKKVNQNRSKAYKQLKKQENKISALEKEVRKLRQRLRRKENKTKCFVSPSPNSKVKALLGREKVSPKIKKRLFVTYALEKQLKETKKNSPKSKQAQIAQKVLGSKILRKYRVQRHFSSIISYKFNKYSSNGRSQNYQRKTHKCKTSELKEKLMAFYEDDLVSKMCPGKRDVKRKGRMKKQRRILLDSLKNLHNKFCQETNSAISYTTFARARPFWVTPPTARDRDTCACIEHSNIDFLISSLHSVRAVSFRNGREGLNSIVCSTKSHDCLSGKCKICKNNKIKFNEDIEDDINVKYYQWKTIQEKRIIKGIPKMIKRMIKEREVQKLAELKQKLNVMMTKFKRHVFHWLHQGKQKKTVKENLSSKELMLTIDFSENYCAKYQEEVQSMHFGASKKQISLHTSVLHYNNGEKITARSFCTVSDNLAHQAHAIWAHLDPVLELISKEFPQTRIFHFFSDSPSNQYRNRTNLWLMKHKLPNYFPLLEYSTWNYSESGHGKGAMDGVGGSLKRRADEKVLHGCDITNASDFVEQFINSKITVLEVSSKSIEQAKRDLPNKIDPVPIIMQMKQIAFSISHNLLFGRRLSCFICLTENPCPHYNISQILSSEPKKVKKKKLRVQEVWASDEDEDEGSVLLPNAEVTNAAGCSHQDNTHLVSLEDSGVENINSGNFVLVRFLKESRKSSKMHQFLGVVQSEMDSNNELKVMFLKSVDNENKLFVVNEKDISFVSGNQIVAVLSQPKLILKGDRVYYKFMYPINVFG